MRAILLITAGLALSTGGLAQAEPSGTLVVQGSRILSDNQRAVSYADLRLASASGQAQLRQRVGLAIAELCDPRRFSVAEPQDSMKCSAEAWAEVKPRLEALSPRFAAR
jgi:UrcA family protein